MDGIGFPIPFPARERELISMLVPSPLHSLREGPSVAAYGKECTF